MSKRRNSKQRNHLGPKCVSFTDKTIKRLPAATPGPGEEKPVTLQLMKFDITWDVMPDPMTDALPASIRNRMADLFDLVRERPETVVAELRELAARHPEVLSLQNWLVSALRRGSSSDRHEAFLICVELFQENPGYFFARTTLADLLLDQGRVEDAAKLIFGEESTLPRLYPGRKIFHISEIRHWAYLCGRTKILQGDPESARSYREMLNELEPGSPAVQALDNLVDHQVGVTAKLMAGLQKLRGLQRKRKK